MEEDLKGYLEWITQAGLSDNFVTVHCLGVYKKVHVISNATVIARIVWRIEDIIIGTLNLQPGGSRFNRLCLIITFQL